MSISEMERLLRAMKFSPLVLATLAVLVSANTHYVTPVPSMPCPEKDAPCFTLSQYASNQKELLTTGSTLKFVFLPGNHTLKTELKIQGAMAMFFIKSLVALGSQDAIVTCTENTRFVFENISHVVMKGLELRGCVQNRIFSVEQFVFEDCSLQGGNQIGGGLDLYLVTYITILRSVFHGIKTSSSPSANTRPFGAVAIFQSDTVIISNCTFINNTVTGDNGVGAAVFAIHTSYMTVNDSIFSNNALYGDKTLTTGGAIGVAHSKIVIQRSTFSENRVVSETWSNTGLGGGALAVRHNSTIVLHNCSFINNVAKRDDRYNSPVTDSLVISVGGGAMYASNSTVTIINCRFTGNSATSTGSNTAGGAMLIETSSPVTVNESVFDTNSVTGMLAQGGALMCNFDVVTTATIVSCNFTRNLLRGNVAQGGALASIDGITFISSSIFNRNVVIGSKDGNGGAVLAFSSNVFIEETTFAHNAMTAKVVTGGAIHYMGQIEGGFNFISISNSSFFNNSIKINASAEYSEARLNADISSQNSTALLANGAAMFVVFSIASISNCTFTNNSVFGVYNEKIPLGLSHAESGAAYLYSSIVHINGSIFTSNTVIGDFVRSGALSFTKTIATIDSSEFKSNAVYVVAAVNQFSVGYGSGGAIYVTKSNASFSSCTFIDNRIQNAGNESLNENENVIGTGGAIYATFSLTLVFNSCTFQSNAVTVAVGNGGAIYIFSSTRAVVNGSSFTSNKVNGVNSGIGGAIWLFHTNATMSQSTFSHNSAEGKPGFGGAVYHVRKTLNTYNCAFISNKVTGEGGALYLDGAYFVSTGYLVIQNHTAITGTLFLLQCNSKFLGNIFIANNNGSIFVSSGVVSFLTVGDSELTVTNNTSEYNEGGAFTLVQTTADFSGKINLLNNSAKHGGAIFAKDTLIFFYGEISILENKASLSGGGIYAYQSDLSIFVHSMEVKSNSAIHKGGGIHAIASFVRLVNSSKLIFEKNHAEKGGGAYLEQNAQIYVTKVALECTLSSSRLCEDIKLHIFPDVPGVDCNGIQFMTCLNPTSWIQLRFVENSAKYGGAIFVRDETYSTGVCHSIPSEGVFTNDPNECFIQTLRLYSHQTTVESIQTTAYLSKELFHSINVRNTYFTNNSATVAGSILYGGLLDRCKVSPYADVIQKYAYNFEHILPNSISAMAYILSITDVTIQDFNSTEMISSDPVRVCFCNDNKPDCSFHPQPKYVNKGAQFEVSLVAVDQINNTIADTIIHASVSLPANLGKGQSVQKTKLINVNGICTELSFSIFSQNDSETLHLYAEGPCAGIGISEASLTVNIAPCPVGFVDTNTSCDCDPDIYPEYISDCFIDSDSVLRRDSVWFTFENDTDFQGYILHHHCPFDYCLSPSKRILVNLTDPNGADVMCAFNRSRKLCGSCKDGLSLSFGSSRCLKCSNNMLALLIVFAIAGIALVAFLLLCNFTVAIGTINSLIFYANVFAANRAIFFPFEPNFLTIFIAWLNLDFGFETCFYDGMDTYVKTWLQLAFPLYIITLVVLIIVISDYSPKFAALFKGKNPIATLATLILLSYTKLLRIIITSLSSATLDYSDGSQELVWLADGNVPYLRGKHIPLFILALVIVMVGVIFTALLFSWQWLVYCPNRGPMKWTIGNTKVIAFIDAYHNPFSKHHRYWIGLMLFVRVMLYLISTLNVLGDPHINLLSINSTIVVLLFYRHTAGYKHKIHKSWLTFAFESISLANLIGLASVTFYVTENTDTQVLVVCISNGIAFITFLAMILYHTYMYVLKKPLNVLRQFVCPRVNRTQSDTTRTALVCEEEYEPPTETEFDALPIPTNTVQFDETASMDNIEEENNAESQEARSMSANKDPVTFESDIIQTENTLHKGVEPLNQATDNDHPISGIELSTFEAVLDDDQLERSVACQSPVRTMS